MEVKTLNILSSEDDIKAMYTQDRQTATIYSIFAGMAIIISSLGLLGISLLTFANDIGK